MPSTMHRLVRGQRLSGGIWGGDLHGTTYGSQHHRRTHSSINALADAKAVVGGIVTQAMCQYAEDMAARPLQLDTAYAS
jgi:hypothetical protein